MASTAGPAAALSAVEGETAAPADLLAIILDVNPLAWHACGIETRSSGQDGKEIVDSLSFEDAVRSMLVLANAHMALRFENHLVIYAAGLGQSTLLYSSIHAQRKATHKSSGAVQPSPDLQLEGAAAADSNSYQTFRILDEAVVHSLRELYPAVEQDSTENVHSVQVAVSSALAKTLCHINRMSKDDSLPPLKSRILVLSVSGETSTQYISIMNCIFAAQKASIPIDVCKVFGDDTVFLQQASHLTKASYYRLERRAGLLQYLLMAFLPGLSVRRHLHLPTQEQIDLRAACFCHKKIVDIGYVCSVCLSIFCSPLPVCLTCRTKFPMASLRRLMGGGGASLSKAPVGAGAVNRKKRPAPSGEANGTLAKKLPTPAAQT